MNKDTQKTFEVAMEYLERGYSILPVGDDKRPLLKTWKYLQDEAPTEDEVTRWLKQWPEMNIGIVTGKVSNLTVLDLDVGHATSTPMTEFPETLTHGTPSGGIHLLYEYQPGFTVSANAYAQYPYTDMRSDSGYIVAPPSSTPKGEYTVIKDLPLEPFPVHLFPQQKPKKTLTEITGAKIGNINDTLASLTGRLLHAEHDETKWQTDVLPAIKIISKTFTPPPFDKEILTVFNSIAKKEKQRRSALTTATPVIIDGKETGDEMKIMKNRSGIPYCNMSNVVAVLDAHPDFKSKIRYNLFRQEIEIDGVPLEDNHIINVQHALQTKFQLHNIGKEAVYSALIHCAYSNVYDEAKDWLTGLKWDGEQRLFNWLSSATNVEDNAYNRGVGTQWFIQIADRIMNPGCIADYMIVLVGPQGIGKSSLFQIIGGKWYKPFTGNVENKDFYLTLRGALIIDLDEGATLYKAEALKMKTIITQKEDEFRAPYDRVPKKFPRRFVFSMSTNSIEPFRDETGNRRYWAVDLDSVVNFKWLEENREQLFAESLYWLQNKTADVPQVPKEEAERIQESHLPDDSWTDLVVDEVRKSDDYCEGDPDYNTTIPELFSRIFPNETLMRLDKKQEIRIGNILRNKLGLEKRQKMIDGERKNRYYISENRLKLLQSRNATKTKNNLDEAFPDEEENPKITLAELGF